MKKKKWGMTVDDIKGLFWSTDERLIMINACNDNVSLVFYTHMHTYRRDMKLLHQ